VPGEEPAGAPVECNSEVRSLGHELVEPIVGDAQHVRNAATFYGSAPLYAPNSRDGRLLLEPGQTGYYVPSSVLNSALRSTGNGICCEVGLME